jgi:hypothetical protein
VNPGHVISEEPRTRKRGKDAPRVAIVAAGAGARGAFEAGALSVLVPWLAEHKLRPTVFVGTSAGSINASLLAATAELEPDEAGDRLLAFWRSLTVRSVYRSPPVALGATHVVAVATHPESYPAAPPVQAQLRPPDLVDSIVSVLGSLLADRMTEDLQTLDKLNANVDARNKTGGTAPWQPSSAVAEPASTSTVP